MIWITLGAIFIGLSLGMLGSGGSILAVPIFSYWVGQSEKLAVASSLAVVGGISLIGAIPYAWKNEVDWRSVVWFGLPGMLGSWLGAVTAQRLTGAVQLLFFSVAMFIAAWRMLANRGASALPQHGDMDPAPSKIHVTGTGLMVGTITGIVGVGGGFLIVPALVVLLGLSMRRAIGTSLLVISINAFSGFAKYVALLPAFNLSLDWHVIDLFIVIGAIGTLAGNTLGARLPQRRLKDLFATVLLCIASYIVVHELPKLY